MRDGDKFGCVNKTVVLELVVGECRPRVESLLLPLLRVDLALIWYDMVFD